MYDDQSTIVDNYFIRHWRNFPDIFTSKYFRLSAELTYRPVVTLSYFIDFTFWNSNPAGYHLTNVLIHLANCMFFFLFCLLLLKKELPAFVSALLFSSYPLLSESVNAIGFREDLIVFLFMILSFLFFLKSHKGRYSLYYPLSLFCYFFGLFSKEMAITLPALIILHDFVFHPFLQKNTGLRWYTSLKSEFYHYYSGYILISLFYLTVRFYFLHNPMESEIHLPLKNPYFNFLTMTHVLAYYIKLLFLPFPLNVDYVVPVATSLLKISFWISTFLLTATGILTFRSKQKNRYIFFCILWFFITLSPVMNIIPLGNIMAERFLYVPCAGICMVFGILLTKSTVFLSYLFKQNDNRKSSEFITTTYASLPILFVLFFLLAGSAYLTLRRNTDWKDEIRLWSKTLSVSPNSARSHVNLGNAYEKRDHNNAAFEEYKKALKIDPNDADLFNNIGIYYNKMYRYEDAIACYKKSIEIYPQHTRAHNNLGVIYTKQRKLDEAIQEFNKAISINHFYPDAHNNLGIAYYRKGFMDQAEQEFRTAVSMEPNHAEAHNDLGILYNDRQQFDNAIHEFQTAVKIKPDYANAHMNLGAVLLRHKKDKHAALFHLRESIKLDPKQDQAAGINKLIQQLEHAN
ncbi:MAG: tetratricopeptide repeat protein [Candidatus Kuenenia sp.]|nr:tetratricopeptide repeat protein [Candidatus Kuenenia hertensis]